MRILVTRPEQDAAPLKAQLIGMGHEVLVEPLLNVRFHDLDPDDVDLREAQALIATSRNALRALARSSQATAIGTLPVFAVGPGTAATAKALGFAHVVQGPSDATALVGTIAQMAEVNAGPLVYLAGAVKAADVGGELRRLGFHVQEPIVYSMEPAPRLSEGLVARIAAGEVDGVILMSSQTALIFMRLVGMHGLTAPARRMTYFCLSQKVADRLAALSATGHRSPAKIVPIRPNQSSLLAEIARGVVNLP